MNGCLKGLFRLGCATAVIGALVLIWWFREPILRAGARVFGGSQELPPVADTSVGAPTPSATASGEAKIGALDAPAAAARDSVILNANEMASLIGAGIDWSVRKTYDSLRVELLEGALVLHARLDTRALPPDALGPLAGFVGPREPLRLGGTVSIERPGRARFKVEEMSLRGIAFPAPAVRSIARQMAGANAEGAIPFTVDAAIADIAIHPTGVVLYRSARR
ncbi:MAG: hypothetical protein ACREME_12875 [Gemmatimonadales bacterium]